MANDKILNLTTQMSTQQDNALETYLAQMLAAKQPLLIAYQRREITAEEYEQTAGETVVETLTQQYAMDRRRQLRQMYDRVKAGYITEAECEAITGEPYDPMAINPLRVVAAAKNAAAKAEEPPATAKAEETPAAKAEEAPAAAPTTGKAPDTENVTIDASQGG